MGFRADIAPPHAQCDKCGGMEDIIDVLILERVRVFLCPRCLRGVMRFIKFPLKPDFEPTSSGGMRLRKCLMWFEADGVLKVPAGFEARGDAMPRWYRRMCGLRERIEADIILAWLIEKGGSAKTRADTMLSVSLDLGAKGWKPYLWWFGAAFLAKRRGQR